MAWLAAAIEAAGATGAVAEAGSGAMGAWASPAIADTAGPAFGESVLTGVTPGTIGAAEINDYAANPLIKRMLSGESMVNIPNVAKISLPFAAPSVLAKKQIRRLF